MDHAQVALLTIFVLAAVVEIVGLAVTASLIVRDNNNGTGTIAIPTGWTAFRGPALIVTGILIGLSGNIVSLFMG